MTSTAIKLHSGKPPDEGMQRLLRLVESHDAEETQQTHDLVQPIEDSAANCFNTARKLLQQVKDSISLTSLNTAIQLLQTAASAWPEALPGLSKCLDCLGTGLLIRFLMAGDQKDVEHALLCRLYDVSGKYLIELLDEERDDAKETATGGIKLPDAEAVVERMTAMAMLILGNLFQPDSAVLSEHAILLCRQALNAQEIDSKSWRLLQALSEALIIKFHLTNSGAHADEAITHLRQVHQAKPNHSTWLCGALVTCSGGTHLQEAWDLNRERQKGDSSAWNLMQLGYRLLKLYQQGDSAKLDEVILAWRKAASLLSYGNKERESLLHDLGLVLQRRCAQVGGDPDDINEAVELLSEAVDSQSLSDPSSLGNLATAFQERFKKQGNLKDIEDAIKLHTEALELQSPLHPNRSTSLNNLALAILTRFDHCGDPDDIEKAIKLNKEALQLRSHPNPDRGTILNNLASAIHTRFGQRGNPDDIDEAIKLHRQALELRPGNPPHPARSGSLNNLGNCLHTRFHHRGDFHDIVEAIELRNEALALLQPPHPGRSHCLDNLARAMQSRFEQQPDGNSRDIDKAIELHREALRLRDLPHPDRRISLNSLASSLQGRFRSEQLEGNSKDINEAIYLYTEAAELSAHPHPGRADALANLANALIQRFKKKSVAKDADIGIKLLRKALGLWAPIHPNHVRSLLNLATALETRWDSELARRDHQDDFEEAIRTYSKVVESNTSTPLIRFSASILWARMASRSKHGTCIEAYNSAIASLPQVVAFDLDLHTRREMLTMREITSVASESAACAMSMHQQHVAIEFLEATRAVFWAQALKLHPPIDHVTQVDESLATALRKIGCEIEQASFRDNSRTRESVSQHHIMFIEAEGVRCRELNKQWAETIEAVRQLPGCEDFLHPKKMASLQKAAKRGPIAILLADQTKGSAFLVTSSDIQCVDLPEISLPVAREYAELFRIFSRNSVADLNGFLAANKLAVESKSYKSAAYADLGSRLNAQQEGSLKIEFDQYLKWLLKTLWAVVVKPVLNALKLTKSNHHGKSCQQSRLWWCPTGPFVFLPIHAAGIYEANSTDHVSQYVISSYTPTLTALLNSPSHMAASFKMLAVAEPNAPGYSPLPGTEEEVRRIRDRVPGAWFNSMSHRPANDIAVHLQDSSLVHFACHGIQDENDPLNSGLMFSDKCLKVSEIMQKKNNDPRKRAMSLSFLSACETAKGDHQTPDEALHLAASLMFAGFSGVVATMWNIDDSDGPKVADEFYKRLFDGCKPDSTPPVLPDLAMAAEALHFAVNKLREEPGTSFRRWVPFVHYGV
ncbi:CHAT domain-containing protein [Mycena galopus ATCC 62051]|nr:CHAT domain-containing protein [Mycena galopus ATCC 62051]